ncbi:hypothetical protein [Martelella sp. HB161492]|uniref:hypothetical protein n=1 Tax=Martelella sp. HB161492 TaxID=2720726 RepID=UPI0015903F2B|nr:hypothetical protein [Martelella sp. HB161492]
MRWLFGPIAVALALAPNVSADQKKVSPDVLAACQKTMKSFTQLPECFPTMDVAIQTLAAFKEIFPPAAAALLEKCNQLNDDNPDPTSTCVKEAVKAA